MDYYDFLQSSDQRKWGLAQKRLALSQCQGNNNWADRDENQGGREGVKIRRDVSN